MKISDNRFEFSVIMSVYQVKEYMEEAIASLERQTIGFERIQLILVDDGSTDGSDKLCDSYQQKYPDQVIVIHKENGGLSSAKNVGLPHAQGRYVSFFDPDDILDSDAFQKVSDFMHEHENETDVCCIPFFMFGDRQGPHPLNNKFEKGSRVIDLMEDENADCFLLSSATSFYKREVIQKVHFETRLVSGEDAVMNLGLQISKPRIGAVADTRYHYRRYSGSLLNTAQNKRDWYFTYLNLFTIPILDAAEKKYGFIPRFIQNAIMYDLRARILQHNIDEDILTEEEARQYHQMIIDIIKRIDDDVILSQERLDQIYKVYLLYQKHPDDFLNIYGNLLDDVPFLLSFIRIDQNKIIIEGRKYALESIKDDIRYHISINNKESWELEAGNQFSYSFVAGQPVLRMISYKATISLDHLDKKEKNRLYFYLDDGVNQPCMQSVKTEIYAPFSSGLSRSYWFNKNYLLEPMENGFSIRFVGKHHGLLHLRKELAFDIQLLQQKKKEATKAVICRLSYYILCIFLPKDIWLITDKADKAGDNGEALFRYLVSLKKQAKCHPVFVIRKDTSDYEQLSRIGKVVPYMSWSHKILHLIARHTISAYSFGEISSPFLSRSLYYGDLLQNNKIVFLQHGITKDDVSSILNRYHKNFRLFVTAAEREYESIINGNYGYNARHIILTGFPRYDRLYDNKQKYITVMPTWVASLVGRNIPEEGRRELLPGFEQSDYYRFYTSLLNDPKLLDAADESGYKLRFLVHPVFISYVDRFRFDDRVEVLYKDIHYNEVFAESAMITTDYSSVFFDFAYLKKPVIYTQFASNHYEQGYFSYERDGFGEVEHTVEGSVDRLIEYMRNGCQLKEKYRERIDRFFAYHDQKNSERVYRAILDSEQDD